MELTINSLFEVKNIESRIAAKNNRILQLRAIAEKTTVSFEGGGGSGISDKVGKGASSIADLEKEIESEKSELVETEKAIRKIIMRIPDSRYRQLLEEKHLNGYTFERISCNMHYSYVHVCYNLYPQALREFQKELIEFKKTACYNIN